MSGGKGDLAWQHAQLFRAPKDTDQPQLRLTVKLKREDEGDQADQ